ncbi:hypothetical protein AAG906_015049 [Vitis piasezkii]
MIRREGGGGKLRKMKGEISNFVMVWVLVYASLIYCYSIAKILPKGITRFLAIIPIVFVFLILPLNLHTMHLGGTSAFFIAWLANFKLLLFAFGKGPLSADPSISLLRFIAVACLPIKIQQKPSPKTSRKPQKSTLNYAVKALLLALVVRSLDYNKYMHPKVILCVYSLIIYFTLELILAVAGFLPRLLLGVELEAQFDEPYLSTSLQDFWEDDGTSWSDPLGLLPDPGPEVGPTAGHSRTFVVSALMHELMFYYLARVRPTWEITWFFLLHGLCLAVEVLLKKALPDTCRLPRFISGPLAVVFVMGTGFWLFFPQLLRCKADVRAFDEYAAVGAFFKSVGTAFTSKPYNETVR